MSKVLVGDAELQKRLERLKTAAANRCMRAGVTEGAKIVNKRAKANVAAGKSKRKLLRKSIGQVVKVYRHSNVVAAVIGPRVGMGAVVGGKYRDPVKYGHIEEKGRRSVRARKAGLLSDGTTVYGAVVGPYAGRPFLRPALENAPDQIRQAISRKTMERIEAEARK